MSGIKSLETRTGSSAVLFMALWDLCRVELKSGSKIELSPGIIHDEKGIEREVDLLRVGNALAFYRHKKAEGVSFGLYNSTKKRWSEVTNRDEMNVLQKAFLMQEKKDRPGILLVPVGER